MPRRLRVHLPGGFYHVTLRGNHQADVFVVEQDRHLLNTIVARAIEKFDARLHAYCWMRNHLHFLIQVGSEPLANPMRNIAGEFARAMQTKLATTGHFFERRYHAKLVGTDSYLLEVLRYIHRNPVDAPRGVGSIEELIAEACRRFEVMPDDITSPARNRYLSKVRAWIAHQAVKRRICNFATVARRLSRDESTLRQAIRENRRDVE